MKHCNVYFPQKEHRMHALWVFIFLSSSAWIYVYSKTILKIVLFWFHCLSTYCPSALLASWVLNSYRRVTSPPVWRDAEDIMMNIACIINSLSVSKYQRVLFKIFGILSILVPFFGIFVLDIISVVKESKTLF